MFWVAIGVVPEAHIIQPFGGRVPYKRTLLRPALTSS